MRASVKARYANGVFTPLEPVDLDEGTEVLVSVGDTAAELTSAEEGHGDSLAHLIEELHSSALVREPGARPVDLAEHYKHYLHGHPKDETL